MPITFNGVSLPVGAKQYWGSTEIRDIVFNGVNVWHYDSAGPVITFTSSSATTTTRAYTLKGRVIDADSGISSVKINGTSVGLDANGYFSANYNLSEGSNTFTLVAVDNAGNSSSNSLSIVYVSPSEDYGTNVQYSGIGSQDWASGLSCKYSNEVDNDLNYSIHGSASATVTADFRHKYAANYMSISVNIESGGDTQGNYEWWLMDNYGNVIQTYNSGGVGSGTYGITVNTSDYANRTDIFLRVKARSEVGDWVSAYSSAGWGATVSMTGCTQGV